MKRDSPIPITRQGLCARTALQPVMAGDRQAGQTLFHLLRVFKERQQRRVGRDPLVYLEASASSSSAATPPLLPLPVTAKAHRYLRPTREPSNPKSQGNQTP